MQTMGFEPTRAYAHKTLNLACIAIPHILNPVVNEARIVFVRTQQAID
jgi:mannitol/fructose-specific phosphotransferase system IIA component (Ntr-type)